MGYLRVSLITDQSECLICYFLCTELTLFCNELTLFCTELPENCIYLNQSELSNFSMCIIKNEIFRFLNLHLPLSVYCIYQDWFQKLMPCQLYLSTDWKHQNLSGDENLDIRFMKMNETVKDNNAFWRTTSFLCEDTLSPAGGFQMCNFFISPTISSAIKKELNYVRNWCPHHIFICCKNSFHYKLSVVREKVALVLLSYWTKTGVTVKTILQP